MDGQICRRGQTDGLDRRMDTDRQECRPGRQTDTVLYMFVEKERVEKCDKHDDVIVCSDNSQLRDVVDVLFQLESCSCFVILIIYLIYSIVIIPVTLIENTFSFTTTTVAVQR